MLALLLSPAALFGISVADTYLCVYTPAILLFSGISLLFLRIFGTPINCASSLGHVTSELLAQQSLVNDYCIKYASNFTLGAQSLADSEAYELLSMKLVACGVIMFAPVLIFLTFRSFSQFPFGAVIRKCLRARSRQRDNVRSFLLSSVADMMHARLAHNKKHPHFKSPICVLYAIFKLSILVAIIPVYYFICSLLMMQSTTFSDFFFDIVTVMAMPVNLNSNGVGVFVKRVKCYFPYLSYKKILIPYVCTLGWNMIAEKIFMFVFIWMSFVLVLYIASAIYWLFLLFHPNHRKGTLRCLLSYNFSWARKIYPSPKYFKIMGDDTWLTFELISQTGGVFIASLVMIELWKSVSQIERKKLSKPAAKPPTFNISQPKTDLPNTDSDPPPKLFIATQSVKKAESESDISFYGFY